MPMRATTQPAEAVAPSATQNPNSLVTVAMSVLE